MLIQSKPARILSTTGQPYSISCPLLYSIIYLIYPLPSILILYTEYIFICHLIFRFPSLSSSCPLLCLPTNHSPDINTPVPRALSQATIRCHYPPSSLAPLHPVRKKLFFLSIKIFFCRRAVRGPQPAIKIIPSSVFFHPSFFLSSLSSLFILFFFFSILEKEVWSSLSFPLVFCLLYRQKKSVRFQGHTALLDVVVFFLNVGRHLFS